MAQVQERTWLGAEPEEVWKLVGDFVGFIEVLIADIDGARLEVEGEGIGMLRRVSVGTDVAVERLEEHDDAAWRTSYSMPVTGPFPMTGYLSTIQLEAVGDGECELVWTGSFEPDGVAEDVAAAEVRKVYTQGIAKLRAVFS
ncbi:SRPBCC family protein [Actinomadura fibrosa]|uniref:SRPBCC family protein n=1 Tax=Actinomadura fibrosa TaxID=111802 RepID=A0ABW2XN18_9ACTN|nr:SRPBCC family protein [Actinomadura fibrosa]